MKTNDLQKKQALCEELNMNFDEANELFATETLQSMQMARVTGGNSNVVWPGWAKVWEFISKAASLTAVLDWLKETFIGTPAPGADLGYTITQGADGTVKFTSAGGEGRVKETITITSDSITANGVYGQKIIIGPTPAPK